MSSSNRNQSHSQKRRDNDHSIRSSSKQNDYEYSLKLREEKENFMDKKFNKLRRDKLYGPLPINPNKIRSKDYATLI